MTQVAFGVCPELFMSLFDDQPRLFSTHFPTGIADRTLCRLTFTLFGCPFGRSALSTLHGNEPAARSGLLTSHY